MRRGSWFRSLAATIQLWLVAVLLGHGAIYTCPEHDGVAPAIVSEHAPVVGHQHAAQPTTEPREASASDGGQQHHCGCLCPGDCAGGGSSWLPARVGVAESPLPGRIALSAARPIAVHRSSPDHFLPYPNGPPSPLSA